MSEDEGAAWRRGKFYGWTLGDAYFGRAEARGFAPLDRQKSIADLSIAIDNGALQHLTIAEQLGFWLIKEGKYTEAINRICQALGDATNPTVT